MGSCFIGKREKRKRRAAKHLRVFENYIEYRSLVMPALADDFQDFLGRTMK